MEILGPASKYLSGMHARGSSFFDTAIEAAFPRLALSRAHARSQLKRLRKFEAASTSDRYKGWTTVNTSPNSGNETALSIVKERVRYLDNSNPYMRRGKQALADYIVGKAITPYACYPDGNPAEKHEEILKKWADTAVCDLDGRTNLYGLQASACEHLVRDGEVLIKRVWMDDPLSPIPLKLQLLESDYIDTSKHEALSNKNIIIQGVEFNPRGQRVAYWLWDEHPMETRNWRQPRQSKRYDARDFIHLFKSERAGQARGISWFVTNVLKLKELDDAIDAHLVRQKIASCFVGVFHDLETDDPEIERKKNLGKITPGSWMVAPPGQTVEFSNPPQVEGYKEFIETHLHSNAVGLSIPYMILTGDYSKANYTSSRGAKLDFKKSIERHQYHIFMPQFCDSVYRWFSEACEFVGIREETIAIWQPPKWDLVDPLKDLQALALAEEKHYISHPGVIRELGEDPHQLYKEISGSNDIFKKYGIKPRLVMIKGGSDDKED